MATEFFPISDLSPQFINASWADIVEAEELEDFEAIERLRCTSASSLSNKENQEEDQATPFTLCNSISRVPLSTMENHCVGVTTSPSSDYTTAKRPVKRSYADAVQPSRAKRTNSSLPCTPTSDNAFSPSSSSCPSELSLCEATDEYTPEANEKCEGSGMVPAQRRLSFTAQRTLSSNSDNDIVLDEHRLKQRQKQLDFGRNTPGYQRYVTLIPKWKRNKQHPKSPNKYQQCSKRSWDGQIRKWRRMLHAFDPPSPNGDILTVDDVNTAPVDLDETSNMDDNL